jgi:hypothetical protein
MAFPPPGSEIDSVESVHQERRGEQQVHGVDILLREPIGLLQIGPKSTEGLSVGCATRKPAGLFLVGPSASRATTAVDLADLAIWQALRAVIVFAAVLAARFPGHP